MPDLTFYATVATVLPVLYLALLFQANILEQPPLAESRGEDKDETKEDEDDKEVAEDKEKWQWLRKHAPCLFGARGRELFAVFFAFYLLFATGVGELICLRALYLHRVPSHEARTVIAISLFVSVLTLTSQQTVIALSKRREASGEADTVDTMRGHATVIYILVLAAGVILIAA